MPEQLILDFDSQTGSADAPILSSSEERPKSAKPSRQKSKPIVEASDSSILVNEQPHPLPKNWNWVRLASISKINPSKQKPEIEDEELCTFIPMAAVSAETGCIVAPELRPYKTVKKGFTSFINNDVIFAKITPCMENGKSAIAEHLKSGIGFGSTEFHVLRTSGSLNNKYLHYYLRSGSFLEEARKNMSGTVGQQRLPAEYLKALPFPLPPLPEQTRIVANLESLLGNIREAREITKDEIAKSSNRKSSIIRKAFSGNLTSRWREENLSDCNKIDYLERISNWRKEQTKKKTELVDLSLEFNEAIESNSNAEAENRNHPKEWLILKAKLFCDKITAGTTPKNDIVDEAEIPFLKVYNIVNNKVDFFSKPQYIPSTVHNGILKRSQLTPGDVIMNIVGPPLKKIAIIPSDFPQWNINQAIVRFRPMPEVLNKFLYYALIFEDTLKEIMEQTRGVVGQANISITQSNNLLIPLPPYVEQIEIVRILDHLLLLEEQALEQVENMDAELDILEKSILARAFRGELGTNDPNEPEVDLNQIGQSVAL